MSSRDNSLNRFLNEKSPFLHETKFNLSLKEYPLNPVLLPIPLDNSILDYETTSLEVLHRWTGFQNLNNQVDLDSVLDHEFSIKPEESDAKSGQYDEAALLEELGLSNIVPAFILDQVGKIGAVKKEAAPKIADTVTIKSSPENHIHNNWLKMSKDQRINAYMDYIRDSFVNYKTLTNPNNPNLKQKKVYKIMPNVDSWKNSYVQTVISGGLAEIDRGERGFIKLTKETSTAKSYEYYRSIGMEGKSERFSFMRNYTSQQATKKDGNENYYLLSLGPSLYKDFMDKSEKKPRRQINDKESKTESVAETAKDVESEVIYILSIKGQKSVLTKAGGGKKNDYVITYEDEDQEEHNGIGDGLS